MDDEPVRGSYPDISFLGFSGLERMKAGTRNQMPRPPIHHLFGLRPVSAGPASVTFTMPASPWLQNALGLFFAGTSALVADAPLGGAIMAPLGPGKFVVTSDLSVNYLRPADPNSGQLIARARPIDVGNRVGLAEALIEDAHGRLIAHATTRCFVVSIDPPERPAELPEIVPEVYDTPDPYLRPLPADALDIERWSTLPFLEGVAAQQTAPPPFARLFGLDIVEASEGKFVCSMRSSRWLTSPAGTIYGGVIAYLADSSLSGAFSSVLAENEICAPLDLKVQYIRPAFPDDTQLRCESRIMHRGKTFATAQAEITNEQGKTVALATSSATVITGRSWSSFAVVDEAEHSQLES